jgi:hypothetical protein
VRIVRENGINSQHHVEEGKADGSEEGKVKAVKDGN